MTPPPSRILLIALAGCISVCWPWMEGCSHSTHTSALRGGAPVLLQEDDGPHNQRGGTNPNAPYMYTVAASKPQLVKRAEGFSADTSDPCNSKDLVVTEIAAAVNGKYRAVKLAFDNQGLTSCHLSGYPSIALLDKSGTPVASIVVDRVTVSTLSAQLVQGPVQAATPKPAAQVLLTPKGEAWFQIGWSTGDGCPVVSRISVSAPGDTESFTVNHPLTVCDGHVQITTLHADQDTD
jgi:Protein of unknown function (DUF4232)